MDFALNAIGDIQISLVQLGSERTRARDDGDGDEHAQHSVFDRRRRDFIMEKIAGHSLHGRFLRKERGRWRAGGRLRPCNQRGINDPYLVTVVF